MKIIYIFNNNCSIKISIIFNIDVEAKNISFLILIFITLLLIFWIYIYIKTIINKQNLFVHSIILCVLTLYFLHSILFTKWSYSFNYNNIDSNYSLWNIKFIFIRIFSFLIKLFIGFCICVQFNIIELREHYNLIKDSKSPLFHMMIITFILCFELYSSFINTPNIYISVSEVLNFLYYLFAYIILYYRYSKIRKIINTRIIESYPKRGLDLPSLLIKNKIIIKHFYVTFLLNIIIIMIYLFITFLLQKYKNMKMSILLLHNYDILFLIGLIIVYFPQKINNYYIEYSFLEGFDYFKNKINNKSFNVYRKFNPIDYEEEENLLMENGLDISLVENPYFNDNINDYNEENNYKEKFNNIKVAFITNELNEKIESELKAIISSNNK